MPPSDLARERLAARARRTKRIRRGVGAGTVAAFALAWGVIAHDGAMGTAATATASTTDATTDTATPSSSSTLHSSTPVTTAQS